MSSSQRDAKFWIGAWWPVALSAAVIATSSSTWFGADHTTGPLRWLWQSVFGAVSDVRWDVIHFFIRKSGHFTGYGLIGFAWLRAWRLTLPRTRLLLDIALAVLGSAVLASSDELHQAFLPNRTGSPWDVLLDCCGATAMCLLIFIGMRLFRSGPLEPAA